MAAAARPSLTAFDQGASQTFSARFRHHIKLSQEAVMTFGFHHKHFGPVIMGKGPANWLSGMLGDQHDAVLFGAAMLQFPPMLDGEIGIAAAVGLEGGLVILKAVDKRQDRRLVLRQTGVSNHGRISKEMLL